MTDTELDRAAQALLEARASGSVVDVAAFGWAPASVQDAYAVQARVATGTGAVGGWKVGAPSPEADALFAPMPAGDIVASPATLPDGPHRRRGIEVEVAYRLAHDLPAREQPYSPEEVGAAVDTALALLEVVETRLSDRDAAGGLWALADNQSHGGLVLGEAHRDWRSLDLAASAVRLRFDDDTVVDRECRNAGGHPFDMLVRLANLCGEHCGGLRAGQIVTTGSLMGVLWAPPGARVRAAVSDLGEVAVDFVS